MPPTHTGMAEHVEARSLAELNYLASHPPQYPTNPTEKKQDPLILYISRVPGTRGKITLSRPMLHPRTLLSLKLTSTQISFSHPLSPMSRTLRQKMSPAHCTTFISIARGTTYSSLPIRPPPLRLLGRARRAVGLRSNGNLYPQPLS